MPCSSSSRAIRRLLVSLTIAAGVGCGGGSDGGSVAPPPAPPPPPPAAQLAFSVQPASSPAGTLTPAVQVTAQTATGTVATSFTGGVTIALGSNAAGATLSGTTSVSAVAGVATFSNLVIDKVGSGYTLSASSSGLTGATSAAFGVTPGVASRLTFTVEPSGSSAGGAIAPAVQVTARDAHGNTASGFTGNVTVALGINPTSAVLSGTTTVAAVAGVATFSGLAIDRAGTGFTFTASAAGLSSGTSAAFNVAAVAQTTRLYISPILDSKLRTSPTANTGASIEFCLSTMEWTATLAGDMAGTSYTFNLGVKTGFTSSGTGTLRAEIIHKRGAAETVLASTLLNTTSTYVVRNVPATGPDPVALDGDVILLRVRIVAPSPGLPCVAEFNGPATDNYIAIPRTTIRP